MPKIYSEQERNYIRTCLKREAADCLSTYGIKGTTVDELVKRIPIPKGTFYLFYASKEQLIFEVLIESHEHFESQIYERLAAFKDTQISCDSLTEFLYGFFKAAESFPLFSLFTSDELGLLAKKLPPELLAGHFSEDDTMIENILLFLNVKKDLDIPAFSSAFRTLFISMFMEGDLKDKMTDEALKILIRGLVIQLF